MRGNLSGSFLKNVLLLLVGGLLFGPAVHAQQTTDGSKESLDELFDVLKSKDKARCGHREEQIRVGKKILEEYGNDELNKEVIEYVRKQIPIIESKDKICRRNERYNQAYKNKNWAEFFAVSKEVITDEGESPLALDVMLTLVSVGNERIFTDKDDTYIKDTVYYAKLAIQLIESGKAAPGRPIFSEPYSGTSSSLRLKNNFLKSMNYILGNLHFNKLNDRSEAVGYLYKALQYKADKNHDDYIYKLLGEYYFDEAARLVDNGTRNKREGEKLINLQIGYVERALDAFARARKSIVENNPEDRNGAARTLYQRMVELYRFRFNLPPTDKPEGLDRFVEKLISQPLPDPLVQPTMLFEEPLEIRLKRNKIQ